MSEQNLVSTHSIWQTFPFWTICHPKSVTGHQETAGLLSVYLDRGVIPYSEGGGLVHKPADNLDKYQLVEPGDLVMNNQQAWRGSVGVSSHRGIVSPAYLVFSLDKTRILPGFASYLFRDKQYIDKYMLSSLSVGDIQRQVKWPHLRGISLNLPDISTQCYLTNLLDQETTRIDTLIAKKTRFIELIKERIVSLASEAPDSQSLHWARFSHLCEVISRPVLQQDGNKYTKLGLLNRGRGIFKRDETDAEDMGDSEFFWVQPGDLILSGQFAWEGAVALATEEHTECVVSHRFPIIRGVKNKVLTEYLFAYFLTSHGDFVLNDCSRGSAGRNRPLNMNLLLGWKIPVPCMQVQREIAMLVHLERQIGEKVRKSIELLKEKRSALITAAVTGKIDVREAA